MKKVVLTLTGLSFLFAFCVCFAIAQDKATKDECIAKCKEAAALIKSGGFEAAKTKIEDPKGGFVWKDSYVFVQNLDQLMVAHPNAKLIGKSMRGIKDIDGKMFNDEMFELVTSKGEGWVSYKWPKPGEKDPSPKSTFIYRVPGENLFVGAGIYE